LMCASHSGEPMHTDGVADMLARIGCRAEQLQCGCHVPSYYAAVGAKVPPDAKFTTLHHNCSGKHAGMLAYCRLHDHPVETYLALMQTAPGDWVAKAGAEGVQGIGIRSRGLGIAIKIADGNTRALYPVIVAVLEQLGLVDDPAATPLADHLAPRIENFRGLVT